MARIGIYGGSFNPPHIGHVKAAEELIGLLSLDRLYVVPASQPPHKQLAEGSPTAQQRLDLCRLAFGGIEKAEVSDIEIVREGTSYTVDTLTQLKAQYPDDELFLLMGSDMLLSFEGWYKPDVIVKLAKLGVMRRLEDDASVDARVAQMSQKLRETLGADIELVDNHPFETSSTEVRNLIFMDCLDGMLPQGVADAIRENSLYRYGTDCKGLPFERLMSASLSLHLTKRIPHVIGCCETAQKLAQTYGADQTDAARAGILHDVTKMLGAHAQRLLCRRYQLDLTQSELDNPKLLHAKTGASVARHIFGESEAVCDAIYWHTTGKADMTLLEKIIYIADYMEPNRDFDGVERLRSLVWTDLDAALLEGFRMSLNLLKSRGKVIDPNSLQAWQYLAKERNQLK